LSNKEQQELSIARDDFLAEHKKTTKFIARLALTSNKTTFSFKMKLAKLYKLIFRIK
jgi:hypothetical protein